MKWPSRVSRIGAAFALTVLLALGIPMTNYVVGVGKRAGWNESIQGENSAIILFGAGLPVLGATVIAYLVGNALERRHK